MGSLGVFSVAAKRFRERGLEGIGVADVMKEAGVTVGGFYKHVGSRDEMVVEALAAAFKDLDVWEEHTPDMAQLLQNYLTEAHRDAPGTGCAMGALLGDMTRGGEMGFTKNGTQLPGSAPKSISASENLRRVGPSQAPRSRHAEISPGSMRIESASRRKA
jgi:AcrR family transcriptional regulator